VRVDPGTWELQVDGATVSSHAGYRDAVRAAEADALHRRRRRAALLRVGLIAAAGLLLIPATVWREVPNDAFPPAREYADGMEAAYRAVDTGAADIGSFSAAEDGFTGDVRTIDRGGVTADYRLLIGEQAGDCYLIRWVRFEVPFVARLLPRYECAPGDPAYSFSPSGFEAIAVNITSRPPLNWEPVLPPEVALVWWFFPAMILLLGTIIQQAVSLSMVFLRDPGGGAVGVERVEAV
jgi:hypothetical protein